MKRMFTIGTVHFQARAADELRDALMASANQARVPWWLAVKCACRLMLHACRAAATAQLTIMAGWSPEEWAAQEEVREERARRPVELAPLQDA